MLLLAVIMISGSFATSVIEPRDRPQLDASKIFIPIGKSGQKISLLDLSRISRSDLEHLTGNKMNLFERIAFHKTQKRLSRGINENGTITDKRINQFFSMKDDGKTKGFHAIGFILGFVLGLIGVLIAYVMNDDEDKKNRVKWSWIGFAIGWVLVLGLYLILVASSL